MRVPGGSCCDVCSSEFFLKLGSDFFLKLWQTWPPIIMDVTHSHVGSMLSIMSKYHFLKKFKMLGSDFN